MRLHASRFVEMLGMGMSQAGILLHASRFAEMLVMHMSQAGMLKQFMKLIWSLMQPPITGLLNMGQFNRRQLNKGQLNNSVQSDIVQLTNLFSFNVLS